MSKTSLDILDIVAQMNGLGREEAAQVLYEKLRIEREMIAL